MAAAGMGAPMVAGRDLDTDMSKQKLTEFTADDIKPRPEKQSKYAHEETPDDKLFLRTGSHYGGDDTLEGKVIAKLSHINDIRKSHMSRRVENQKRLKLMQQVYKMPGEEGGGLGGGLGGL